MWQQQLQTNQTPVGPTLHVGPNNQHFSPSISISKETDCSTQTSPKMLQSVVRQVVSTFNPHLWISMQELQISVNI